VYLEKAPDAAMLFGHLARMDESADARIILTAVPQSDRKRPAGRPHTSRVATMKNDERAIIPVWKMPQSWYWTGHSGGM